MLDPQKFNVEFVTQGITFTATASGFRAVGVSAEEKLINKVDVRYNFSFVPNDLFNSNAVLKIVAPQ